MINPLQEIPFKHIENALTVPSSFSEFIAVYTGKGLSLVVSEEKEKTTFLALKIIAGFSQGFLTWKLARAGLEAYRIVPIYVSAPVILFCGIIITMIGLSLIEICTYLNEEIPKKSTEYRREREVFQNFFNCTPKRMSPFFKKYKTQDAIELFKALDPSDVNQRISIGVIKPKKNDPLQTKIPFFILCVKQKKEIEKVPFLLIYFKDPKDGQSSIIRVERRNQSNDSRQPIKRGEIYLNGNKQRILQQILNREHQEIELTYPPPPPSSS